MEQGRSRQRTREKAEDDEAPDELVEDLVPHLHHNHPHSYPPPCDIVQAGLHFSNATSDAQSVQQLAVEIMLPM